MTNPPRPDAPDPFAFEKDLDRRLRRFLAIALLMLLAGGAALTHLATLLEARADDVRSYARHP